MSCQIATNNLKLKLCKENDYKLAQQNGTGLKCNNMKDYTMEYYKLNVLILADLFENFINIYLKDYEIDYESNYV